MKHSIPVFILAFLFLPNIAAQNKPSRACPSISVTGPAGIVLPGEIATYTATVEGVDKNADLNYVWSVSKGTIESGQGTSTVKIRISEDEICPTVTVQIIGLPNECPAMASETPSCDPPPQAEKIGEFPGPISSINKEVFKRIVEISKNNPTSQIYIFVGTDPLTFRSASRQLAVELAKFQGEESRITFVDWASAKEFIQVWQVPPGAAPPTCEHCEPQSDWLESQTRTIEEKRINTCPGITINGPRQPTMPGGIMTFRSIISGKLPRNVRYKWSVNVGEIVSGQGSRVLRVRAPTDGDASTIRASLSIPGLPRWCNDWASEEAGIARQPLVDPYDRYGDIPLYAEKGRLQSAAAILDRNPGYRILIIKRTSQVQKTLERIREISAFLKETLKLSPKQFQIVTKIAAESSSTIWFVKQTTDIRSLISGN